MRSAQIAAAGVYALQAAVLAIVLVVTGATRPLPVLAVFRGGGDPASVAISSVDLGWALVTLLVGGALSHALSAAAKRGPDAEHGAAGRRALVAGWSQGAAIFVFLIAQLNGIVELTSLVPLYAITATAVVLVGIDRGREPTWRRPGAWAAVVGIVPWGVIAFAQIGSTLAVGGPTVGIRVVTLVGLAVALSAWVIGWRRRGVPHPSDVGVTTAAVSVLVWTTVALAVL